MNNYLIIVLMNDATLKNMIVSAVSILIIISITYMIRNVKYKKSPEGKLQKKIDKNKSVLSDISKYESGKKFINKDLITDTKKRISKEIENDLLQYELDKNEEYIELQKLKKKGILDTTSFNKAIDKIKDNLKQKPNDKIKILELENGENIKVEQHHKGNLKKSRLLSHLDLYNDQLIRSEGLLFLISNNIIKNIFLKRSYENGLIFAQQKSTISIGDIILNPEKVFASELVKIFSFCSVKIRNNRVIQVYWIKKGKTINKNEIEIYQKHTNKRTYNDLVFINSSKPKDGFHLMIISGLVVIIRTKNGKIN